MSAPESDSVRRSERFRDAWAYAEKLHDGQFRKGTQTPYITHPQAVAALVIEHGGDEDQAIAALLHDGPEDQGGLATLLRIRELFGNRVGDIVEACTDTLQDPKPDWRPRKEAYLAALPRKHKDALLVSAADKLHNATCILADYREQGEALWSRFNTSRDGQLWYYRALVNAYREATDISLVEELDGIVRQIEGLVAERTTS
jgi:(p)ppGpp synthase/HD superfamily hydrolase